MAAYKYTAIGKDGVRVSGLVDGTDEFDAARRIKQTCPIIIKLTEVKPKKDGILSMEIGRSKLNEKAFTLMCSQFAVILRTGVPIGRATHLIADKISDRKLKSILRDVAEDVESGQPLSVSFHTRGGDIIPAVFIETIAAGEEAGNLSYSFQSMYEYFDKQIKIRTKVRNALSYPLFILGLSVIVVMVLMIKVVPTFISIFGYYESSLPWATQSLIWVSRFFQKNIVTMIAAILIIGILFFLYRRTAQGQLSLSRFALKLPVWGNIRLLSAASEFANNLTIMLASGLPLPQAVLVVAKVIDNYYISQEIGKIPAKLEAGKTLGECMLEAGCLPDILVDMTAVGEKTGELEKALSTTASYFDSELDTAIQGAMKTLEPMLLIFVAGIVGYIVLSVYFAMFQMYSLMG